MELNETVQIAENNREREQQEIHGVPDVMPECFDCFTDEKYPHGEQNEAYYSKLVVPRRRGPDERVHKDTIPEEGPVGEGGLEHRVSTPRLNPAHRVNTTWRATGRTRNPLTSKSPPGTGL